MQVKRCWRYYMGFKCRDFDDDLIYKEIYLENGYKIKDEFEPNEVVVDIGMHIGCFSKLALDNQCWHLLGFEPKLDNFKMAEKNLKDYMDGECYIYHKGVWRSDTPKTKLHLGNRRLNIDNGGYDTFASSGEEVDSISLDDIIRQCGKIDLLKIDCEGVEFPILLTSKLLNTDTVYSIAGEYHEIGGNWDTLKIPEIAKIDGYFKFTIDELKEFFESKGYNFEYNRNRNERKIGYFWVTKKDGKQYFRP